MDSEENYSDDKSEDIIEEKNEKQPKKSDNKQENEPKVLQLGKNTSLFKGRTIIRINRKKNSFKHDKK